MLYIEIGERQIPASISGLVTDRGWDGRSSKSITCEMTHGEADGLFVDGAAWRIIRQEEAYVDETGTVVTPEPVAYDNSEFCVAGPITDNRDGTVTVKMGTITDGEALAELMEVLA